MNVIAAALRELIAAGVTGDALVTAIERIENATLPTRSPGAARQARYRERHKASQSVTSDDAHSIEGNTNTSEIKKRKKVTTALSSDWPQSDACWDFAAKHGWPPTKIKSEIHRFRDYALANNRRQADWDAAWRNWVTSPFQKPEGKNGHAGNRVMEAFDIAIDRARGEDFGRPNTMRDITPKRADPGKAPPALMAPRKPA